MFKLLKDNFHLNKPTVLLGAIGCIAAILATLLLADDWMYIILLGVLPIIVYYFFFRLSSLFYLVAFFTPLSIFIEFADLKARLAYPTEPIMLVVLFLFWFKVFFNKQKIALELIKHPVSLALFFCFVWMIITSVTAEYPLVAVKYILSKLWVVTFCYIIGYHLFIEKAAMKKIIAYLLFGLGIVIAYTLINHAAFGFSQKLSYYVSQPFFTDHTNYAACLAIMIMPLFFIALSSHIRFKVKPFWVFLMLLFAIGLALSFTRAAWLSVVASIGFYILLRFRIRFWMVAISFIVFCVFISVYSDEVLLKLKGNETTSSADALEHVQSVSNVSTDPSNLERLNRWKCAVKMFKDRPVMGFGPGNFMFCYSSYQRAADMTIISTTEGDYGSVHNEYLGPLSEQGLIGLIFTVILFGVIVRTGMNVYYHSLSKEYKFLAVGLLLGLITYIVHGLMNNFLDQDKLGVPFWTFTAMLVAMDVRTRLTANRKNANA